MRVQVIGVLDDETGVDDSGERLCGEIAGPLPLSCGKVGLGRVVLGELGLDIVVNAGHVLLQRVDQVCDGLVGAVLDLVPLKGTEILIHGLCLVSARAARTYRRAKQDTLSLMVLCCCTRASSPSRMVRRLSPTLATTCSHADSSLARSSACWTRASRVPILKLGMAKGKV